MNDNSLQVLLVEDNAVDALLFRQMFSKEAPDSFKLTHLTRLLDAEKALATGGVDIVLLDMGLPDAKGLDTVRRAHAAAPNVPMIVLTGLDDEVLAAEAMKAGALDYLIKGQIENRALPRALRHAIERHRMQLESDLIKIHELEYKDQFLSHVSHELRSPVFAIYQFVTILLDKLAGEVNPQQNQYLEIVLRNVKQLQSMIDDLLEVTRVQGGKLAIELQSASAPDAIDYAVETLRGAATAKDIALSSHQEPDLPAVWADPKRMRQILVILIDNAIKFTPPGGIVRVEAKTDPEARFLTIEVVDSGCGISPEMTERVFERLFQVSDPGSAGRKGLGLGLHICRELVTRQGGQIRATSASGKGSVFTVTLPVFSLATVIAPSFGAENRGDLPFTLIVVEINSKTGWFSDEARGEICQSIRETLQQCLYYEHDILLPRMGLTGAVELFFILAMTDHVSGDALIKRITKQLSGSDNVEYTDLTHSATQRSLDIEKATATESKEIYLERVAGKIQQALNEETRLRMARSG